MAKTTQTRIIRIVTKDEASSPTAKISKQYAKMNRELKKSNKEMKVMSGLMNQARAAVGGFLAAMGVRELARSADAFQLIKDRIRALWGEGEDAEEAVETLIDLAKNQFNMSY